MSEMSKMEHAARHALPAIISALFVQYSSSVKPEDTLTEDDKDVLLYEAAELALKAAEYLSQAEARWARGLR